MVNWVRLEKKETTPFFTLKEANIIGYDHVGDICFLIRPKQCNLRSYTMVLRYVTGNQATSIMRRDTHTFI